ncbi:MAG: caspase family protein [Deltaproteobacteria bacterium]|nr:caspase family protein [Deltaproteobacteria bacterium]
MRYSKIIAHFICLGLIVFPGFLHAEEKPEIFVQMGHSSSTVPCIAFSPDGRYALSGGYDQTVKLWDVSTGREVRTFLGHLNGVKSVAFSPDRRYALSADWNGIVKLWEISTGKEIRTFKGDMYGNSVSFSADGQHVLYASISTIQRWELSTGRKLQTPEIHLQGSTVTPVAFSSDGQYALAGDNKNIKLWEISTGRVVQTLQGHSDHVYSVALSSDSKYALSGSADHTVKLWNVSTGKEIKTFQYPQTPVAVAFSPDGRYALSGSCDGILSSYFTLWEMATGKEIKTYHFQDTVSSVVFNPDGRYILSCGYHIALSEVSTGKEIRRFHGYLGLLSALAFSADGRYALSHQNKTFRLWDVAIGKEIRTIQYPKYTPAVAFSPDGKYALSGSDDKTLKLWDMTAGKELRTFNGHMGMIRSVAFSPDGEYALSGSNDGTFKCWEVSTGRVIWTFQTHLDLAYLAAWISPAAFSPDGRYALFEFGFDGGGLGFDAGGIKLVEVSTGRELRTFGGPQRVSSVAFSPDSRYAVTGGYGGDITLWEVSTGRQLNTFKGIKNYINSIAFSPDGQFVLAGSWDNTVRLFDISTGKEVRSFLNPASVKSVAFSPDGRYVLSGSGNGVIKRWDVATGNEICTIAEFPDGEWIVITPEGYYNSSANGDKYLNVRVGNNVYGIDQYRATFYKSKIVDAALRLGDTQKTIAEVRADEKEKPTIATIQNIEPPFIVIKSPEDGKKVDSNDAEIALYVEDRNQPIKKVKVFVNGRLITGEWGRGIKISSTVLDAVGVNIPDGRKTLDLKIPVALDGGENLIEISAFNGFSEGRKAIRIYLSEEKTAKKGEVILPNLWILSIGVNKYMDKRIPSLSYAAADAAGIVEAFRTQKGRLFREVHSLVINDNSLIKPTFDNVLDNLNYVKKAGQNDIVILFIAGHGLNDESGDFYFLPSDAAIADDGSIRRSKAISWREIKSVLDIPAKKLIFADTCHSEGVSGKKTRGVDNDKFVKELQEANAVIFTSSRGRELSQESDAWKHGAFTHALIEGLKGKADLLKRKRVTMKELDTYVSETVPQITNGAQHPITNTPDGYVNFTIAVMGQEK